MGSSLYNSENRSVRAKVAGFHTKAFEETFTQQKKKVVHDSMSPKGVAFRESRDSDVHPLSYPVQLYMDTTASMGDVPKYLVKDGLPHIMSTIIQRGVSDIALMFGGVGDHECDRYPLQIGQFESGDAELDMWLTRTYIERGGGSNPGESYFLAWYFAAYHTQSDAWDKRKWKTPLITIGDEPGLDTLPHSAIKDIFEGGGTVGAQGQSFTDKSLLQAAQEKHEVYHIHVVHGRSNDRATSYWRELLGQNCIIVENQEQVADAIVKLVVESHKKYVDSASGLTIVTDSTTSSGEQLTDAPGEEPVQML